MRPRLLPLPRTDPMRIRSVGAALLLLFAVAASADVAVPPYSARVIDLTGTLSGGAVAKLEAKLADLETQKGSQIAVLVVPTTQPEEIEQYGIRVADAWKAGRKNIDDGAILLVAKNDRRVRIEVGRGLEGALPDAIANRIIDENITPRFKAGDFDGGIEAGVDKMIAVVDGRLDDAEMWSIDGLNLRRKTGLAEADRLRAAIAAQILEQQDAEVRRISQTLVDVLAFNHDMNNAVMSANLAAEELGSIVETGGGHAAGSVHGRYPDGRRPVNE